MSYADPRDGGPPPQDAPAVSDEGEIRNWPARAAFSIVAAACVSGVFWVAGRMLRGAPAWQVIFEILLNSCLILLLLRVVRKHDAARRKEERALRRKEQELTFIADQLPAQIAYVDRELRYRFVNAAAAAAVDSTPDKIIGRTVAEVIGSERLQSRLPAMQKALAGERVEFEAPVVSTSAEQRYGSVAYVPYRGPDGTVEGLIGLVIDITARKRAEAEARELAARLTASLDSLTTSFITLDRAWRLTFLNRAAERVLGKRREEVIGQDARTCFPCIVGAFSEGQYQLSLGENRPVNSTAYHAPQGAWFEVNAFPSEQGLAFSFQDITARKKAEEALRQSETGMALAQRVAKFGSWEVELTTDILSPEHPARWSDEAFKIVGHAPQSFQPTHADFLRLIHPEDLARVTEAWATAVAQRTHYAVEHRIILPDGQVRVVQEAADIFEPAGTGGFPIAVGAVRDITEEANAKEALRASEERFRAVFEQAPVGICEIDGAAHFKRVNRKFSEMLGYTHDELVRLGIAHVTHAEQRELCLRLVGEIAAGVRQTYDLEKRFLPRDGGTLWAHLTLTALQPSDDQPRSVMALVEDITARKRAQAALERSEEQLRALTARLERLREEDRTRIAREIHDELGQTLTGLTIDLRWLEGHVEEWPAPQRAAALDRIVEARRVVAETMKTVQSIAADLRPGVLDKLGLAAALEYEARRFTERTGMPCLVDQSESLPALSPEVTTALFRVFQECLTNIVRHAAATQVWVHLYAGEGEITLKVEDNGRGLNEAEIERSTSLGLLGIRERVTMLGGSVSFVSREGGGTVVSVRVPTGVPKASTPNSPDDASAHSG